MSPREVWETYGFPLISKEQAYKLYYMKTQPDSKTAKRGYEDGTLHCVTKKYRFLVNEQFTCHDRCCMILKKRPAHEYEKRTGLHPFIGTMASESMLRRQQYLARGGCNSFDGTRIFSTPLSIWNEQDNWDYVKDRNLPISEIYYKGVRRTGCVCCGFGAQHNPHKFDPLYRLYPKLYAQCMNYTNNGVTFRDALIKVLSVDGILLPDQQDNFT